MRLLVTGASGMLGSTIVERWRLRREVYATGGARFRPPAAWRYQPFDLRSADYAPLIAWARPDVIVHCAAMTNVDACEAAPELALAVNAGSVERLRRAAPTARLLYISSDAVFAPHSLPASTDFPRQPLNAYGRSKLRGEELALDGGGAAVIRTTVVGWNLDPTKQSFAEWLVRSLERGERINLFEDALFSPIAAPLLADELERLLDRDETAVFHVAAHDAVSKWEFGVALCERLRLDRSLIRRERLADVRFDARRSPDQRLDVSAYEGMFGRPLPSVQDSTAALAADRVRFKEREA